MNAINKSLPVSLRDNNIIIYNITSILIGKSI